MYAVVNMARPKVASMVMMLVSSVAVKKDDSMVA